VSGKGEKGGGADFQERRDEKEARNGLEGESKEGWAFAHPSSGYATLPLPDGINGQASDQTLMSAAFLAGSAPD
jgi:hypothetical protein